MASGYGTQTDAMQKAAQNVMSTSEELQQQLRSLEGALEPLAAQWKGQAASAFQALMVRFQEDGQKLAQALGAIAEALDSTTKNYAQAEQSNATSISAILGNG